MARVPVVSIGGGLGAGKTTLVNRLLREADGRRIVVFVNDFGAINIDHDLIEAIAADRISLKNGCVCCSLNPDLVSGIADQVRSQPRPDLILIELSGVSDPRALEQSLLSLETAGFATLDTRLYVLDADGWQRLTFEDSEALLDHSAAQDIVLLNKVDLAGAKQVAALRAVLSEAAPYTQVVETVNCDIAPSLMPGGERHTASALPRGSRGMKRHALSREASRGRHVEQYSSWSVETAYCLDRARFDDFARSLPKICVRAKGILRFSEEPAKARVFQLVGYRATLEAVHQEPAESPSRLVVIGRRDALNPKELECMFQEVLHRTGY